VLPSIPPTTTTTTTTPEPGVSVTTQKPVATSDSTGGEGFCNGKPDGMYADPTNCYRFVQCSGGTPYLRSCAPGTKYDPERKICDYPENVSNNPAPCPTKAPFVDNKGKKTSKN